MKTVVLCCSKGGVGKTTLTCNLSVVAHGEGAKVGLLDLDPMESLANWHALRHDGKALSADYALLEDGDLSKVVRDASRRGFEYLFIDCPPALTEVMKSAIEVADVVVIPCRASPLDLQGEAVSAACKDAGVEYLFVLNAVKGKSKIVEGSRAWLEAEGRVAETEVQDRVVHASAMITGAVGSERDEKTREEIKALWGEVKKSLRRVAAREKARA